MSTSNHIYGIQEPNAVTALERTLRERFGARRAVCVSSATTGLMGLALALGLRGAEFLTNPYCGFQDSPISLSRAPIPSRLLLDRKSTRLNSSHLGISYAVFCLKKQIKFCRDGRILITTSYHVAAGVSLRTE